MPDARLTPKTRFRAHLKTSKQKFDDLKKKYTNVKWIWLQEEPENMGAWGYILRTVKNTEWNVVARIESASPATGSSKRHLKRYQEIMDKLLKA